MTDNQTTKKNLADWVKNQVLIWATNEKLKKSSVEGQLLKSIQAKAKMRRPQIEAIETFLWLNTKYQNKQIGEILEKNFEDDDLQTLLRQLQIPENADTDFLNTYFHSDLFANYLFSLPMGAGKTYLIASLIYINFYLADLYKTDTYSSNFIILIPSGLKNSILPSLRNIQEFDPSWILPDKKAVEIKNKIQFEILDQNKSAKKSNRANDPNAVKINKYINQKNLKGLVCLVNAEKVILDKVDKDGNELKQQEIEGLLDQEEKKAFDIKQANELRETLSLIPNCTIFIDEYHHIQKSDNKLRNVIRNHFVKNKNLNSVYGFSGTPYSDEKIKIQNKIYKSKFITNTVYHHTLAGSTGDFLKVPEISKLENASPAEIIKFGLQKFFNKYQDFKYQDGRIPKLAIYSSSIDKLHQETLPLVEQFYKNNGYNLEEILIYHGEHKNYKIPKENQQEFENLDSKYSKKRVILLVQIGKEGWDCQSLSGVILSQKSQSSQISVLQTACRCLREVDEAKNEKGLIVLNTENYDILNSELLKEHQISVKEFETGKIKERAKLISRVLYLKLPQIPIKQLKINLNYSKEETKKAQTKETLNQLLQDLQEFDFRFYAKTRIISQTGFGEAETETIKNSAFNNWQKEQAKTFSYSRFLHQIYLNSFTQINNQETQEYRQILTQIYNEISTNQTLKSGYKLKPIINQICKAFYDKQILVSTEEEILTNHNWHIPDLEQKEVIKTKYRQPKDLDLDKSILDYDNGKTEENEEQKQKLLLELQKQFGDLAKDFVDKAKDPIIKYRDQTLHYLPYYFDEGSRLEYSLMNYIYTKAEFQNKQFEAYYNGERFLSEVKIKIYKQSKQGYRPHSIYTPDFLLIKRDEQNQIKKLLVIETKGEIYKEKFETIKQFMTSKFKELNPNYDFLYLEQARGDKISEQNKNKLENKITEMFN